MAERAKKATAAGEVPAPRSGSEPAAKKTAGGKSAAKKAATAEKSSGAKSPATKKKSADAKKSAGTRSRSREKVAAGKAVPSAPAADLVVLENEDPWTDAELAEQREVLEAESQRLRAEIFNNEAEIADLVRDGADTAGDDQADTGSKTFEREHEMYLTNSHREMLSQTDRALSRIENGTYGVCESCGNPIGKARLQAFPRATLCMSCKQREERR